MERQGLDGDAFEILEDLDFGLLESEVEIVATLCDDDTVVADGIEVDVFDVDVFVL